jgi:hypothetical protein
MTTLSAKLGLLLRKIAATALGVAAKFTARVRLPEAAGEIPISAGVAEVPETPIPAADGKSAPDEVPACASSPQPSKPLSSPSNGFPEREKLIRQRWTETGIKMWSPDIHGSGKATLKIQGQAELLPVTPGQTMRAYDKLEFKLIAGRIVCEGVIIEAPRGRHPAQHQANP